MPTWNNEKLLDKLIADAESVIAVSFGEVVLSLKGQHTLTALAELIQAGQWDTALNVIEAAAGKLATTINSVYIDAGIETLESLGNKLGVVVSYDQVNVRAIQKMAENRLELIREFIERQREATREALLDGMRRGLNPRAQARGFRDSIGLTRTQVRYINNYRDELESLNPNSLARRLRDKRFDRTVREAIDHESPLGKKQIDAMVGRYREKWLKHRSETIARTEALRSVHEGTDEAIQQAIESGAIEEQNARQTWNTALDERVRDFASGASTSHLTMQGQEQAVGVPFTSGAGNELRYPGDPLAPPSDSIQCRCRVTTRVSL